MITHLQLRTDYLAERCYTLRFGNQELSVPEQETLWAKCRVWGAEIACQWAIETDEALAYCAGRSVFRDVVDAFNRADHVAGLL